jgi:hypothetical protein
VQFAQEFLALLNSLTPGIHRPADLSAKAGFQWRHRQPEFHRHLYAQEKVAIILTPKFVRHLVNKVAVKSAS